MMDGLIWSTYLGIVSWVCGYYIGINSDRHRPA